MFNNRSDYALNKKDSTAIVYQDANGTIIRLTEDAFSSRKEFRKWKNWTNMKCHSEEKKEHIHSNHTVSLDDLDFALPASFGIEDVQLEEATQEKAPQESALFVKRRLHETERIIHSGKLATPSALTPERENRFSVPSPVKRKRKSVRSFRRQHPLSPPVLISHPVK